MGCLAQHTDLCALVLSGCFDDARQLLELGQSLQRLGVPVLGVLAGRLGTAGTDLGLMCDWRLGTSEISLQTAKADLNASWVHNFGVFHQQATDPVTALASALQLAHGMQQAPPLGLQHTLQLMRTPTSCFSSCCRISSRLARASISSAPCASWQPRCSRSSSHFRCGACSHPRLTSRRWPS